MFSLVPFIELIPRSCSKELLYRNHELRILLMARDTPTNQLASRTALTDTQAKNEHNLYSIGLPAQVSNDSLIVAGVLAPPYGP
jgi:hypothetical protein